MAAYDVHGVFERIPQLLGMDLQYRGGRWEGGFYLNGDKHTLRKDKLKVVKWQNDIWIHEEGGESMPIAKWLQEYGGAEDYRQAVRILRGTKTPIAYDSRQERTKVVKKMYVTPDVLAGARAYNLKKCNLFVWMAALFGEEKTRAAWERYNVTTDAHGNAVFWFVDAKGRILHDKRMAYQKNGHRNRDYGAWRKYKMADGYNGKCFFGEHLLKDGERAYLVESEKTALLFYLYYGKVCVATGGKNAVTGRDNRYMMLPDMDARDEWAKKGEIWPWWEHFKVVGDHADIGDAIVERISG